MRGGYTWTGDGASMDAIVTNLEGEAAEWVMGLHDKEAPKLGDCDAFLGELRNCFGDNTQVKLAEFEICAIRQGSRPVTEYIREFQRLVEKLRQAGVTLGPLLQGWPQLRTICFKHSWIESRIGTNC